MHPPATFPDPAVAGSTPPHAASFGVHGVESNGVQHRAAALRNGNGNGAADEAANGADGRTSGSSAGAGPAGEAATSPAAPRVVTPAVVRVLEWHRRRVGPE